MVRRRYGREEGRERARENVDVPGWVRVGSEGKGKPVLFVYFGNIPLHDALGQHCWGPQGHYTSPSQDRSSPILPSGYNTQQDGMFQPIRINQPTTPI